MDAQNKGMLAAAGSALQLAGLAVTGLALLRGMAGASSVWGEIIAAAVGAGIFLVGWLLVKRG
jgi:hypothetical protein